MPSQRADATALNEKISQAQKNRSRLACVSCRARRIKCDGQLDACGRCTAAGITNCRYEKVNLAERVASRKRKRETRGKQKQDSPDSREPSSSSTGKEPLPELTSGSDSVPYLRHSQTGSLQSPVSHFAGTHEEKQQDPTLRKHQYARNLRYHHHYLQNANHYSTASTSASSALLTPSYPPYPTSPIFEPTGTMLLQEDISHYSNDSLFSSNTLLEQGGIEARTGYVGGGSILGKGKGPESSLNIDAAPTSSFGRVAAPIAPYPFLQEQLLSRRDLLGGQQSQPLTQPEDFMQRETSRAETAAAILEGQSVASNEQLPFSLDTSWGPIDW